MKPVSISMAFAAVLVCTVVGAADSPAISQAELVRRSQQLYDAVAPGDPTPWKLYLADDAIFVDETGHKMSKTAFLTELHPLPHGYSGSIKVQNAESRFGPGVAILSYDGDETEAVFGQVLHARYHMTDTWIYRNSKWQIVASQSLRYYEDPTPGTVDEARLEDYVGSYELSTGNTMIVSRKGGKLYAQKGTAPPTELLLESPDLFFRPGVEGRRLFHRDAKGRVDSIIDRRNNEDLLWKRVQ